MTSQSNFALKCAFREYLNGAVFWAFTQLSSQRCSPISRNRNTLKKYRKSAKIMKSWILSMISVTILSIMASSIIVIKGTNQHDDTQFLCWVTFMLNVVMPFCKGLFTRQTKKVRFQCDLGWKLVTANTRHLSTYIPILCIKTITIIILIAMLIVIQGQSYKTFYGANLRIFVII